MKIGYLRAEEQRRDVGRLVLVGTGEEAQPVLCPRTEGEALRRGGLVRGLVRIIVRISTVPGYSYTRHTRGDCWFSPAL